MLYRIESGIHRFGGLRYVPGDTVELPQLPPGLGQQLKPIPPPPPPPASPESGEPKPATTKRA